MTNARKTTLFLVILILVSAIIGFIVWNQKYDASEGVGKDEGAREVFNELLTSNKNFALAENFFKSGDYESAISYYQAALTEAHDIEEESQIHYKIALAYRFNNDPVQAIALLKEVSNNQEYPDTMQAYAVQAMGQAFYSFNDPLITQEIFKDSPYKEMYDANDIPRSYRKLFEYASSYYPLGISQVRIANWYAKEILVLQDDPAGEEAHAATIASYKEIIKQNLEFAEADIRRTKNKLYEGGANYIPEIITQKAYILGLLSLSGDESLGDPDEAFVRAIETGRINHVYEAQSKYFYALFLSQKYGQERATDVQNTLKDFYTTDKYSNTGIVRFLRNEKNNIVGSRDKILLIAEVDPDFKEYLRTLGWQL